MVRHPQLALPLQLREIIEKRKTDILLHRPKILPRPPRGFVLKPMENDVFHSAFRQRLVDEFRQILRRLEMIDGAMAAKIGAGDHVILLHDARKVLVRNRPASGIEPRKRPRDKRWNRIRHNRTNILAYASDFPLRLLVIRYLVVMHRVVAEHDAFVIRMLFPNLLVCLVFAFLGNDVVGGGKPAFGQLRHRNLMGARPPVVKHEEKTRLRAVLPLHHRRVADSRKGARADDG